MLLLAVLTGESDLRGSIDNEGLAFYLYQCDSDSWEIVLNSAGVVAQAFSRGSILWGLDMPT